MAIKIGNAQTCVVCNSKYRQRPACRLTAHSVLAVFKDPILVQSTFHSHVSFDNTPHASGLVTVRKHVTELAETCQVSF